MSVRVCLNDKQNKNNREIISVRYILVISSVRHQTTNCRNVHSGASSLSLTVSHSHRARVFLGLSSVAVCGWRFSKYDFSCFQKIAYKLAKEICFGCGAVLRKNKEESGENSEKSKQNFHNNRKKNINKKNNCAFYKLCKNSWQWTCPKDRSCKLAYFLAWLFDPSENVILVKTKQKQIKLSNIVLCRLSIEHAQKQILLNFSWLNKLWAHAQ